VEGAHAEKETREERSSKPDSPVLNLRRAKAHFEFAVNHILLPNVEAEEEGKRDLLDWAGRINSSVWPEWESSAQRQFKPFYFWSSLSQTTKDQIYKAKKAPAIDGDGEKIKSNTIDMPNYIRPVLKSFFNGIANRAYPDRFTRGDKLRRYDHDGGWFLRQTWHTQTFINQLKVEKPELYYNMLATHVIYDLGITRLNPMKLESLDVEKIWSDHVKGVGKHDDIIERKRVTTRARGTALRKALEDILDVRVTQVGRHGTEVRLQNVQTQELALALMNMGRNKNIKDIEKIARDPSILLSFVESLYQQVLITAGSAFALGRIASGSMNFMPGTRNGLWKVKTGNLRKTFDEVCPFEDDGKGDARSEKRRRRPCEAWREIAQKHKLSEEAQTSVPLLQELIGFQRKGFAHSALYGVQEDDRENRDWVAFDGFMAFHVFRNLGVYDELWSIIGDSPPLSRDDPDSEYTGNTNNYFGYGWLAERMFGDMPTNSYGLPTCNEPDQRQVRPGSTFNLKKSYEEKRIDKTRTGETWFVKPKGALTLTTKLSNENEFGMSICKCYFTLCKGAPKEERPRYAWRLEKNLVNFGHYFEHSRFVTNYDHFSPKHTA
jgi:hypothetical protein